METDAGGRLVRTLRRVSPVNGQQPEAGAGHRAAKFVWERFGDRRGALVALDPATGGVLAFISKPGYDPNLFIDGIDSQSWKDLNDDWKNCWSAAPCAAVSAWLHLQALHGHGGAGNQIPRPQPPFLTQGYFSLPGSTHRFRDSKPSGWGSMSMFRSIQVSSDYLLLQAGLGHGHRPAGAAVGQFGFGSPTGIDLDGEARGCCPAKEWKRKRFAGKRYPRPHARMDPGRRGLIGIGQGLQHLHPLQVAHAVAILANNGVVYRPHVVKEIENLKTGEITKVEPNRCATIIPTRPISPL